MGGCLPPTRRVPRRPPRIVLQRRREGAGSGGVKVNGDGLGLTAWVGLVGWRGADGFGTALWQVGDWVHLFGFDG